MNKGKRVWLVSLDESGCFCVEAGRVERLADSGQTVLVRRVIPADGEERRDTVVVDRKLSDVYDSEKFALLKAAALSHAAANKHFGVAVNLYEAVARRAK